MSVPAVYLPQAEDDVAAAHAAYEQQQAGLGDRFVEELRDQVDRIRLNPQLYGVSHRDIRGAPLHRFPYVVYYRPEPTRVLVIAVQHGRRSSRGWQGQA